jgi:tetratricopeptide (TPR) repeat protein
VIPKSHIIVNDVEDILATSIKDGAERLLLYFGAAGTSNMVSIRGFAPLLAHNTNTIVLLDPSRGWYNLPIRGLSRDADDLIAQLINRIGSFPRNMITAYGTSMGGYAALLFGLKLGVGRIVACAPQLMLDPRLPHAPKVPVKYDAIASLVTNAPKDTQIDIWYGAESFTDLYNLLRLKPRENLNIHAVSGAMHNVLATLKRHGELDAFFTYTAMAKPFSTKTVKIPTAATVPLIKAGRLFYVHKNYTAVIKMLEPIADDVGLSALYVALGESFFQLQDYEAARSNFERAIVCSHENYDAHYGLGLVLEKLGKDRAAETSFRRSQEFFPSPNGQRFAKLASVQYRIGAIDDALQNYGLALELADCPSRVHYEMGLALLQKNRHHEALLHFQRHQDAYPSFKPTRTHIARLRKKLNT